MKTKIFIILIAGFFILLIWIFINNKEKRSLIKTKILPVFFLGSFILLSGILITAGIIIYKIRNSYSEKIIDESRTVYIKRTGDRFQLIRNGKPFYIKGAAGDSHFYELKEMGGNTIRLYDTINLQNNLDEAQKYGLAVIVDIPIPAFNYNITTTEEEDLIAKRKIKDLINKYKNHKALLIWNLGNEINYPKFNWKDILRKSLVKKHFIQNFNDIINLIHAEDLNHPISTTTWNVDIKQFASLKLYSPGIDLISFNTFGDLKNFLDRLKSWSRLFHESPYYISEFSSDGWWYSESEITSWMSPIEQTSSKKAEQISSRYNLMTDYENCLGSLLFFWGNKYECTDTWFSLFKDEYKSEVLLELEYLWGKTRKRSNFIGLEYMLVDGKGAFDNIIFTSNEFKESELRFDGVDNDSIEIRWEVYPDVWFHGWNEEKYNTGILKSPEPINCFVKTNKKKATFITPDKEGPYRISAYVFDSRGFFATASTPFYVLNPK